MLGEDSTGTSGTVGTLHAPTYFLFLFLSLIVCCLCCVRTVPPFHRHVEVFITEFMSRYFQNLNIFPLRYSNGSNNFDWNPIPNSSVEFVKIRTEPIPKNVLTFRSKPNRTLKVNSAYTYSQPSTSTDALLWRLVDIPVNRLCYWVKWKKYICCFMRATHAINNIYKLISFLNLYHLLEDTWKIEVETRILYFSLLQLFIANHWDLAQPNSCPATDNHKPVTQTILTLSALKKCYRPPSLASTAESTSIDIWLPPKVPSVTWPGKLPLFSSGRRYDDSNSEDSWRKGTFSLRNLNDY